MDNLNNHLKDISEIRTMMEKSSKFLSLSGLSGISAGIVALIGVNAVQYKIENKLGNPFLPFYTQYLANNNPALVNSLILYAAIILLTALALAIFFSIRMAKMKGYPIWNNTSKWMLASLFVPLITGG